MCDLFASVPDCVNLALGATCTASSEHDGFPCTNAIDGSLSTDFASQWQGVGLWINITFPSLVHINLMQYTNVPWGAHCNRALKITYDTGSKEVSLTISITNYRLFTG